VGVAHHRLDPAGGQVLAVIEPFQLRRSLQPPRDKQAIAVGPRRIPRHGDQRAPAHAKPLAIDGDGLGGDDELRRRAASVRVGGYLPAESDLAAAVVGQARGVDGWRGQGIAQGPQAGSEEKQAYRPRARPRAGNAQANGGQYRDE